MTDNPKSDDEPQHYRGILGKAPGLHKDSSSNKQDRDPLWLVDPEIKKVFATAAEADAKQLQIDFEDQFDAVLRPPLEQLYAKELLEQKEVPPELLTQHADHFKKFAAECAAIGIRSLPVKASMCASYLHVLRETGTNAETLQQIADAISFAHQLKGFPDPTVDELVKAVLSRRPNAKANGHDVPAKELTQ